MNSATSRRRRRGLPPEMSPIDAGAHFKHPALGHDRPDIAMPLDDSFAKYAVAFINMSRSMRVRASSAFSRLISICSTLTVLIVPTPNNRPAGAAVRTPLYRSRAQILR